MSATKKNTTELNSAASEEQSIKEKKCFAIMPIADHPDYDSGHFGRVYEHLIKPACERAGFKVVRADDAKASHMIMFDILKNIVECDMAICDLSSKNANVFYELGLRQAFNKKTMLITDGKTNTPFDIAGFRYVKYDHSLRVDSVKSDIDEISAMLDETDKASDDDVNSIVKLLKIQPAQIDKIQLNEQDSLIFSMIKQLDEKMSRMERMQKSKTSWRSFYNSNNENLNDAILENIAARASLNELIRDDENQRLFVHMPKVTLSKEDDDKE